MLTRQKLLVAIAVLTPLVSASAGPLVYVVNDSQQFGTVDLVTGAFQQIGPNAAEMPPGYFGLVSGSNGSLLTLSHKGDIYRINPATGLVTIVGPSGMGDCTTPASPCGPNSANEMGALAGKIYATDFRNDLYSVNPLTGAATLIGPTGIPAIPFVPGAVNPDGTVNFYDEAIFGAQGNLYVTFDAFSFNPASSTVASIVVSPKLYEVDPETGHTAVVGLTDLAIGAVVGMNGAYYGFDNTTNQVKSLNLANGQTKFVSNFDRAAGAIQGAFGLSGCAYLLSNSGTGFKDTGSGSFNAPFCSINVDSNSVSAVTLTGSATVNIAALNVVGPASCAGLKTCGIVETGSGGFRTSLINTGITPFPDPLAAVQPPPPGVCKAAVKESGSAMLSLTPGTYCGGISVTGSGGVTFAPGIYILDGGGLSITGSGSVTGSGIMFYNTFDSTHAFKPIDITGSGSVTLSAPASGPYQGMLFFEDRNAPSGGMDSITGSSNLNLEGNLYFRNSTLDITGSGASTDVMIVANELVITGSGTFNDTGLSSASGPSGPLVSPIE
jgi:hypothetical protein